MKYTNYLQAIIFFIFLAFSCTPTSKENLAPVNYSWKQSHMGGGGYITGLMQDTKAPNTLYARCDVGGVYKSTDRGETWQVINNGMTESHHHSVQSFTISPHNSQVLFRCSGEGRGYELHGDIHKSRDGGESWYPVLDKLDYNGNGNTRMLGEMIQVSPTDSNTVAAAGFSKGVYMSFDMGETWSYSGLEGETIGTLAFHPTIPGKVYVGTLNRHGYEEYVSKKEKFTSSGVGRLFVSENYGKDWTLLYESDDIQFATIVFPKNDPNVMYIAGRGMGIQKSTDGGRSFRRIMTGLPVQGYKTRYETIAISPHNDLQLLTAPNRRPQHTEEEIPLVPLYQSMDGGESWTLLKEYQAHDFSKYPAYFRGITLIGWAISNVMYDHSAPGLLYMSNWFGVSKSEDHGSTWSGNNFTGTETVCVENIVPDPTAGGTFYFVMADHHPVLSTDNGKSYHPIHRPAMKHQMSGSTALAASRFKKGFLVYGIVERSEKGAAIVISKDGGASSHIVKYLAPGLFVQAIREDYQTPGRFVVFVDGPFSLGAGLYETTDWGEHWQPIPLTLPRYIDRMPYRKLWIETELLPVVFSQMKNVCGTNQLLSLDPFDPGAIYLGEWTEGLFKTTDGGNTWQDISKGLPFKNDTASALISVVVDESREGWVYAGFIHDGLWRSENGGDSWTKIFPKDDRIFNASSVVIGGTTPGEIYVASEPLFWSKSESSVYFSPDRGLSWQNVFDKKLGAIRWKGIAVDKNTGTIQGVACGNGAYYAVRK